ncbi:MAG: hypothetical protein GF308_20240 [Candidatus Heimdallarchaeota archaeon]|nr:hypothetical protein [Candidatus Heimdallarchaeota archaeon]
MKKIKNIIFTLFLGLLISFSLTNFIFYSSSMSEETNHSCASYNESSFSSNFEAYPLANFPSQNFSGNMKAKVFTNPDTAQTAVIDYIDSATTELAIEMYSISSIYIMDALHRAVNRGVDLLLIVSRKWASAAENIYTKKALYNLSSTFGISVDLYYSSNQFNFQHSKFIIIDNQIVIIMSANFAKSSLSPNPSKGNREWCIAIENSNVANWFHNVFDNDELIAEPYTSEPKDYDFSYDDPGSSYPAPFTTTTFTEQMTIQTVLSPDNDLSVIRHMIQSAQHTIDVQQMYIKKTWDSGDNTFVEELKAAVNRGVTVRVMVDPNGSGVEEIIPVLLSAGMEVKYARDIGGWFDWCHNKGIIVDEGHSTVAVLISSINWSHESVNENREAGVIVYNQNIAHYFEEVFEHDWDSGETADSTISDSSITDTPSIPVNTLEVVIMAGIVLIIGLVIQKGKKKE